MMLSQLIQTKIPFVDESLSGGLRPGSLVAFWSEVEVEASALALQTLFNRASSGDSCIFVTTNKKPEQVQELMQELGLPVTPEALSIVDFFSPSLLAGSRLSSEGPQSYLSAIAELLEAKKSSGSHTLLVVDSFSTLLDRLETPVRVAELLTGLGKLLAAYGSVGILVLTEWPYEPHLLESVRKRFDVVLELKATPERPIYTFSVRKAGQREPTQKLTLFKVLRPGGAKVYLPKIVVTGPFHAGKTSFIHSASRGAISADRLGTTVALDYGHADFRGFAIDLFGTPGQSRFDPLLEKLGGQALGVIVLVSATDSRSLVRVREQLKQIRAGQLPFVLAVNKVDMRGAISMEAVKTLIGLRGKVAMVPVRAKSLTDIRPGRPCQLNPRDVDNVLEQMIRKILEKEEVSVGKSRTKESPE